MTEEIWLPRQEMWLAGVLQEELVRLGVRQPLAVRVAAVWAETAKSVVTAHKRVAGDVGGMEWELARDISTGDETVQLSLSHLASEQEGSYVCVAVNEYGADRASVEVRC